jgi:hypothetical protein
VIRRSVRAHTVRQNGTAPPSTKSEALSDKLLPRDGLKHSLPGPVKYQKYLGVHVDEFVFQLMCLIVLMLLAMLLGWPHLVGSHEVLVTTHPVGTGASAHTVSSEPAGRSAYSVIVQTLYVISVGFPQVVGLQESLVLIQPGGTGVPAQMS